MCIINAGAGADADADADLILHPVKLIVYLEAD